MYKDHLQRQEDALRFTKEDYAAWRENPVTRALMLDVEYQILITSDSITGKSVDEYAIRGAAFDGAKGMAAFISDWYPPQLPRVTNEEG